MICILQGKKKRRPLKATDVGNYAAQRPKLVMNLHVISSLSTIHTVQSSVNA